MIPTGDLHNLEGTTYRRIRSAWQPPTTPSSRHGSGQDDSRGSRGPIEPAGRQVSRYIFL